MLGPSGKTPGVPKAQPRIRRKPASQPAPHLSEPAFRRACRHASRRPPAGAPPHRMMGDRSHWQAWYSLRTVRTIAHRESTHAPSPRAEPKQPQGGASADASRARSPISGSGSPRITDTTRANSAPRAAPRSPQPRRAGPFCRSSAYSAQLTEAPSRKGGPGRLQSARGPIRGGSFSPVNRD